MSEGFLILASQVSIIGGALLVGLIYTVVTVMNVIGAVLSRMHYLTDGSIKLAKAYNKQIMANEPTAAPNKTNIIGV